MEVIILRVAWQLGHVSQNMGRLHVLWFMSDVKRLQSLDSALVIRCMGLLFHAHCRGTTLSLVVLRS